jgi:hypothetical protein
MVRMTAVKCVSAPQMEVMLKVKQANNAEFSFLKPDNECHAYYLWLKEQEEKRIKQKETVEKAGGMDLLGMYSSSSDDDDESAAEKDQSATAPPAKDSTEHPDHLQYTSASVTAADNTSSAKRPSDFADKHDDAATKARRLKRAKLMRGHYRLQLMEGESKPEAKR